MSNLKLIFLCGLPGSGKSYHALRLSKEYGATIYSSDAIREELFGNENSQEDNNLVFETLHDRIITCLKNGNSAIYDACNINYKRRMSFLQKINNINCEKIIYIIATPYKKCIENNSKRSRVVPVKVITDMCKNFHIPYYFEGWDKINLLYNDSCDNNKIFNFSEFNIDQDNPHHTMSIANHCLMTSVLLLSEDSILFEAGLLHDIGKKFTKSFLNSKREMSSVAHYYNHEYVSAYDSLFYESESNDKILRAVYIMLHMYPFSFKTEKVINKYKKLWGDDLFNNVMKLHEADICAK